MSKALHALLVCLACQQAVVAADSEPVPANNESGWLLPGALPGTVRFAGTNTSFGFGGRLETHATLGDVSYESTQSGRDLLRYTQIPVNAGAEQDNQFRFSSRDSRLWFQLLRPGDARDLNAYVEVDMTESPGSYQFFLRHAYISMGPLLAGRSYTTFIDSAVLPDVDTGGSPGEIFLKRDQLRLTHRFNQALEIAVALEQPDSRISEPASTVIRQYDDDHKPSFVSRLTWRRDWGQLGLATLVRSLRWKQNGKDLQSTVGGIGLSGRLNTGTLNNIRFMANYGNGLGRFIASGAYADASVSRDFSKLNAQPVFSAMVAYQHFWNSEWRSTVSLGQSRAELPGSASQQATERARSAQANLFWSPVPELSLGVEYLHAQRRLLDGQDGELNRLMLSARYTFQLAGI